MTFFHNLQSPAQQEESNPANNHDSSISAYVDILRAYYALSFVHPILAIFLSMLASKAGVGYHIAVRYITQLVTSACIFQKYFMY